jgi:hypothetical protein
LRDICANRHRSVQTPGNRTDWHAEGPALAGSVQEVDLREDGSEELEGNVAVPRLLQRADPASGLMRGGGGRAASVV